MDNSGFDDPRYHRADERHREGVVYGEFEWCCGVVIAMMWKEIEEDSYKIQILASYIGDLENRAYSTGDELSGCDDTLLTV